MTYNPEDLALQAWKRQCDAGLRVIETIIHGATKLREAQLEAAADAHADAEATRKAIAAATDLSELLKLQTEWACANVEKSLAYWRAMYQAVMETDAELAKCLYSQAPLAVPGVLGAADLDASKQALLGIIDNAYNQWLSATQQLYKPSGRTSA